MELIEKLEGERARLLAEISRVKQRIKDSAAASVKGSHHEQDSEAASMTQVNRSVHSSTRA